MSSALIEAFRSRFATEPTVYRAPGRVNLIGEHTDYNDGYVMPAAINLATTVAIASRSDGQFRVRSLNLGEEVEFPGSMPATAIPSMLPQWARYVAGVARSLADAGVRLGGADMVIAGEVPLGSGLSSSAALEVAIGFALADSVAAELPRATLAQLCQRAENEFVGARCGIMDQFIAANGRAGHALLLDCRSLHSRLLPLTSATQGRAAPSLVICNTMVRHSLASGEYNRRREQCEAAAAHFARFDPAVRSLRDVTSQMLRQWGPTLDAVLLRRCRHVVTENDRVLGAAIALQDGDFHRFGSLMAASHASLRDDFEVSCPELDVLVALAAGTDGVYGSRMTGGGFGGCTINLVHADCVDRFCESVAAGYRRATGLVPDIHVCRAADGARRLTDE